MDEIYLGKITFLINAQVNGVHTLSHEEDRLMGEFLIGALSNARSQHPELSVFSLRLVEIKRGCLLAGFEVYLTWGAVARSSYCWWCRRLYQELPQIPRRPNSYG